MDEIKKRNVVVLLWRLCHFVVAKIYFDKPYPCWPMHIKHFISLMINFVIFVCGYSNILII